MTRWELSGLSVWLRLLFRMNLIKTVQVDEGQPADDDVQRFLKELRAAYRHAPNHRASGPGGARNEHWKWMVVLCT